MATETSDYTSGHNSTAVPGCTICEQMFDEERKVLDTQQFLTYVSAGYPWGVMVATKRHDCDGPWALNDTEAVELGRLIPRLSKAMKAMGNERVYMLTFGEDIPMPHYHAGFFARYPAISEAAHEVLYKRVAEHAPNPTEVAKQFAADVRAKLS